jgi:hypothetical protein
MELVNIIIAVAVLGAVAYYFVFKKKAGNVNSDTAVGQTEAPTPKVEAPVEAPVEAVKPAAKVHKKGTKDPRDTNHDGVTSDEEKRTAALADARDTNHNGIIEASEKSAAKKARKARNPKASTATK